MTPIEPGALIAAIDIGTNSIHLVVARLDRHVRIRDRHHPEGGRSSRPGLWRHEDPHRRCDRPGHRRADEDDRRRQESRRGAYAVATSAIREAENRSAFLDRARTEADIDVQVINGFEEARLIHLGVLQALPIFDKRMMGFDIGGGSTEIVAGQGSTLLAARSFRLGAIRLTERFFPGGRVKHPSAVTQCRDFVQQTLAGVRVEFVGHQPEILVASSGTAATLTEMAAARSGRDPANLNGATVTAAELAELVELIIGTKPAKRARIPGLDDKRSDIIVGGAILAEQVVALTGLDGFTYSAYALREGVLLDRMPGARRRAAPEPTPGQRGTPRPTARSRLRTRRPLHRAGATAVRQDHRLARSRSCRARTSRNGRAAPQRRPLHQPQRPPQTQLLRDPPLRAADRVQRQRDRTDRPGRPLSPQVTPHQDGTTST